MASWWQVGGRSLGDRNIAASASQPFASKDNQEFEDRNDEVGARHWQQSLDNARGQLATCGGTKRTHFIRRFLP